MRAYVLSKFGSAEQAFQLQERPAPEPKAHEIGIRVEAFGLNFADVMARRGLYQDCPPLPAIIGYEVVGRIDKIGREVVGMEVGQRVVALTRFGGYADYAVADARVAVRIPDAMNACIGTAIATQYGTAYYCAEEAVRLHAGEHVLVQAAAGGVGTALVQMAKNKGCVVYGTAGSDAKLDYLRSIGVDYPINYTTTDFYEHIRGLRGEKGMDVIFDSLGGAAVKKGIKLLSKGGGRIVCYGAASRAGGKWGFLSTLKLGLGFGITSPIPFLLKSQGLIGVNMLRIADHHPETLQRCMQGVAEQIAAGKLAPTVGGEYPHAELAKAHDFLEGRKSMGKIAVYW